jgi:hypothetical protein
MLYVLAFFENKKVLFCCLLSIEEMVIFLNEFTDFSENFEKKIYL